MRTSDLDSSFLLLLYSYSIFEVGEGAWQSTTNAHLKLPDALIS